MFLYYILLLLISFILIKGFRKKLVAIFCTVLIFFGLSFINFNSGSEIIFFDVQNADCFLYKTPSGKYFVIDTGKLGFNGKKSQVNYILMEYLKDEGIKDIEGLILTHFDADHAGGAFDLIENFMLLLIFYLVNVIAFWL